MTTELVDVAPTTFLMGTDDGDGFPADGEGPVRPVTLGAYGSAPMPSSVGEFARLRGRHRPCDLGRAVRVVVRVRRACCPTTSRDTRASAQAPWWRQVFGADWAHPEGPQSDVARPAGPPGGARVVDRRARPTARGRACACPPRPSGSARRAAGSSRRAIPWGDELDARRPCTAATSGRATFPATNTLEDGYLGTAPVDAFAPNGFGLHNVAGNVWEWCADWFDGASDPATTARPRRCPVIRGGSYLCHARTATATGWRRAARTRRTARPATLGFRVAG